MTAIDLAIEEDLLAPSIDSAPRTIEYLLSLRDEMDAIRLVDPARFLALTERGLHVAEEMGSDELTASFLISNAFHWITRNEGDRALRLIERAEDHARSVEGAAGRRLRMRICAQLAEIHCDEGDFESGRGNFLEAIAIAGELGDDLFRAIYHNRLAGALVDLSGDYISAIEHASAALRLCPKEDVVLHGNILVNLANVALISGDPVTARAYVDEMLSEPMLKALERMPSKLAWRFAMAAAVAESEGDRDIAWANRAVEAARISPTDNRALGQALYSRGTVLFNRGDYSAAIDDLTESMALKVDTYHGPLCLCLLARAHAARCATSGSSPADEPDEARRQARELLARAEEAMSDVPVSLRTTCLEHVSDARMSLGDHAAACEWFAEMRELGREVCSAKVRSEIGSIRLLMKLEREEHEREIILMKSQQSERELANATLQLLAQTELLAELRRDLLAIARRIPPTEPAARELRDRVKRLPCESVDWEKFDRQFREVHPDFVRALTERAPDLTPAEVRICAMVRMNLKSIEIAQIFCTTEKGVEFHRANVRRKLGLRRDEKLPIVLGTM